MSKRVTKNELSAQQEMFCLHYVISLNATQAAIAASYSEKSAHVQGSQLLDNLKVTGRIQELMNKRAEKLEISGEKVLTRLDNIGDFDPADAYTELGALKNIHDIPVHLRKCISSIEVMEVEEMVHGSKEKIGEITKLKFWDKIKANELVGRHLKLFNDVKEHKHTLTLEQLVGGANEPPKDVTPSAQTTPMLGGANEHSGEDPSET